MSKCIVRFIIPCSWSQSVYDVWGRYNQWSLTTGCIPSCIVLEGWAHYIDICIESSCVLLAWVRSTDEKRSPWHLKPFCRGVRNARRTTATLFKRTTSLQILVESSAFQKIPNMSTWIVKEEDVEYFHLMELKKNRESRLWIFQRRKHHIASTKRQNKQVQNIYSERSRQTLRRTRILSNFKLLKQK